GTPASPVGLASWRCLTPVRHNPPFRGSRARHWEGVLSTSTKRSRVNRAVSPVRLAGKYSISVCVHPCELHQRSPWVMSNGHPQGWPLLFASVFPVVFRGLTARRGHADRCGRLFHCGPSTASGLTCGGWRRDNA